MGVGEAVGVAVCVGEDESDEEGVEVCVGEIEPDGVGVGDGLGMQLVAPPVEKVPRGQRVKLTLPHPAQ